MDKTTTTGTFTDAVKVEVEHGTEAGDLARGFNHMVDVVQGAFAARRKAPEETQKTA